MECICNVRQIRKTCKDLWHGRTLGVQRVRSYPFSWEKCHKKNLQQLVGNTPTKKNSGIAFGDYDFSQAVHRQRDRRQKWVGCVELTTMNFSLASLSRTLKAHVLSMISFCELPL